MAITGSVPVVLWRVAGWPLPRTVPAVAEVRRGLTQPVEDRLLVNSVVVVAWLVWAYLVAAVVVELYAASTRRPTRLRVPGPGGALARRLVTGLLVASTSVPIFAGPAAAAAPPARAAVATAPAVPGVTARSATLSADYVVVPGDTLSGIARDQLHDATRFSEIFALNRGARQPDGRALHDPDLIRPRWRLRLPGMTRQTGPTTRARTRRAVPRSSTATGRTRPAPPPRSAGSIGDAGRHTTLAVRDEDTRSVPFMATGSAVFAAAVLASVGRLRSRARRVAPERARLMPPPGAAARMEAMLRVIAEPDDLTDLLRVLDVLAAALTRVELAAPQILGARLRPGEIDLLLAAPHRPAPPPFVARDSGRTWTVPRSELPAERTDDRTPCPLPTLVPVGRDDAGLVLLNLEHARAVAVSGSRAARTRLVTSLTAELAVAPWPTWVEITAISVPAALRRLAPDRVRTSDELDDMTLRRVSAAPALDTSNPAQARIRTPGADLPAPHVILAATAPGEAAMAALTAATTRPATSTVAVVAGDWPEARWHLHIDDDDTVTVPELGLRLHAVGVTLDRIPDIAALLGHARSLADDPPRDAVTAHTVPTTDMAAGLLHDDDRPADDATAPEPAAMLPVIPAPPDEPADELDLAAAAYLGDRTDVVRVTGFGGPTVTASGTIESRRVGTLTELVLLLAAHPRGLHPDDIAAALWPGRTVSPATVSATLCRARTWLGTTSDGTAYLPPAGNGVVRLAPSVLVDWQLFTALVDRAARRPDRAAADLTTALRLVRGRFLEVRPDKRYSWVADTTLEHDLTLAVVDAAHRLARHHLDTGNPIAARDSARIAQLLDDCDERPWRDLMEAEAALGRPDHVAALRDQLVRRLDYEVEEDLSPETVQLLDQLLPRPARRGLG